MCVCVCAYACACVRACAHMHMWGEIFERRMAVWRPVGARTACRQEIEEARSSNLNPGECTRKCAVKRCYTCVQKWVNRGIAEAKLTHNLWLIMIIKIYSFPSLDFK